MIDSINMILTVGLFSTTCPT